MKEKLDVETRLTNLERRVTQLESNTAKCYLDPTLTCAENIRLWFNSHNYLLINQFYLECQYQGVYISQRTVHGAVQKEHKRGFLKRLDRGVYIKA